MRSAHRGRRNRVVVAESGGGGLGPRRHEGPRLRGPEAAPSGVGKRGLWSDERPRRGRPRERRESARTGLLPSRRRRGCRFAAVTGHQRLDRPTLGEGRGVGDEQSRGRKETLRRGGALAPPPPPAGFPPRSSSGHRGTSRRSFDSVRAGLRSTFAPLRSRGSPAPTPNPDHHHRAECEEQPGGERRSHEKPHRRDVREAATTTGAAMAAAGSSSEAARTVRRAGGDPRGHGRRGGRRDDRFRPRHRSLVRFQHHIPELRARPRP